MASGPPHWSTGRGAIVSAPRADGPMDGYQVPPVQPLQVRVMTPASLVIV
jgi:hypothetical protein